MGKMNQHFLHGISQFSDKEVANIENGIRRAEEFINKHFRFDYEVDLIVTRPSYMLWPIEEDGISGQTYHSRLAALVVEEGKQAIREQTVFEVTCHEMSHSLRWEKNPEYTKTLFDDLIFEGLAIALEEEATKDFSEEEKQFFLKEVQSTSQKAVDDMIFYLKDKFDKGGQVVSDMYGTVFFTGNDQLPRWAGYKLGYYFVKKYLEQSRISIFEATTVNYSEFRSVLE